MNAVRGLPSRPRPSILRGKLRACLLLGMLLVNLAGVTGIALGAHEPHSIALGLTSLALLLAALT
ncbi:MAG TPA: hypothetical protein VFL63_12175 [Rhodanobacteraceae bacterium]|nr:hypothetical protein [Rhodanobacteraceae bacterium]